MAEGKRSVGLGQSLKFCDELIKGYITKEFQEVLWKAYGTVGKKKAWSEVQKQMCQTVQFPVLEKFDFEASKKGAEEYEAALTDDVKTNAIMQEKSALIEYLTQPKVQEEVAKKAGQGDVEAAPKGVPASRIATPSPDAWSEGTGRVWLVIGGGDKGGILVRSGKALTSEQCSDRLATDSMIEEISISGERMKYARMTGSGPNIGWISLALKGEALVEPVYFDREGFTKSKPRVDPWSVVHDRVAKRAAASADARVVGMATKGDIVKGVVVVEDGIEWLKTQVSEPAKPDVLVDAYMMINGASVGLGMLLEPAQSAPAESWKVVHTRVAKRATPSKDGEMVGAAQKDEIVKGHVIEEGEIKWLKIKAFKSNNPDDPVDAYMMIDGASINLGVLLEKC